MDEKIDGKYTYKLPLELEARITEIARLARRKRSDTARLLLRRGLEAFDRDRKIADDQPPLPIPKLRPADEGGKQRAS